MIRLTIPSVGIRACSATHRPSDSGATDTTAAANRPRAGEEILRSRPPVLTVTAESLEGHLEMEDPETSTQRFRLPSAVLPETVDSPVQPVATRPGENHRLRWLAVRKVSFRAGAEEAGAVGGRRELGGRRGSASSCSSQQGVVVEDGLAMDGVWAEWSPALFYLAGKSGAMVRNLR